MATYGTTPAGVVRYHSGSATIGCLISDGGAVPAITEEPKRRGGSEYEQITGA